MNEIRSLVHALDAAAARGERCAMATVVDVEGSSYRAPGARMLVSEHGETTGTISAGCLESDVVEHAKAVMQTGVATLVEYDTHATSDDDPWGLGLGCGGVIRVLVEAVDAASPLVEALRSCAAQLDATAVTVATVYRRAPGPADGEAIPAGARVWIDDRGDVRHERLAERAAVTLAREVVAAPDARRTPETRTVLLEGVAANVFVERLEPPVPLLVFGAGFDVLPVVELARGLGWWTEVVDPQARATSRVRFAAADRVTLARVEELGGQLTVTPRTMALLMSHSYAHDLAMLRRLLASAARYIGVMGPRHRTDRMLQELASGGDAELLADASLARLHAPVGLDIGASGPADIALSIVAEMRAVIDERRGGMLRERGGGIHERPGPEFSTAGGVRQCRTS